MLIPVAFLSMVFPVLSHQLLPPHEYITQNDVTCFNVELGTIASRTAINQRTKPFWKDCYEARQEFRYTNPLLFELVAGATTKEDASLNSKSKSDSIINATQLQAADVLRNDTQSPAGSSEANTKDNQIRSSPYTITRNNCALTLSLKRGVSSRYRRWTADLVEDLRIIKDKCIYAEAGPKWGGWAHVDEELTISVGSPHSHAPEREVVGQNIAAEIQVE